MARLEVPVANIPHYKFNLRAKYRVIEKDGQDLKPL